MKIPIINPGDIIEMKKIHPCGDKRFKVIRVGSEIRVVCMGCGRDMVIPRPKFEKSIKKILSSEINSEDEKGGDLN